MSTAIPRWVVVDDMNTDIQYSGPWFQDASGSQDSTGNFGPTYQSTLHGTKTNASLAYAFNGTKVRVYGSNNLRNDSGVLDPVWECFVDKISIGATAPFQFAENNWVFCEQDALVDGPHVLTVNATVLKAQTFWVDQIQYVPSTSMALDQQVILIDSLDPHLESAFGHGWGALGGSANMTTKTGSIFTFDFTGISLSWYGCIPTELPHNATSGTYAVDGQTPVTFLLKGLPATSTTIYNQKFFQTPQLTAGQHKLVVTYQGNKQTTPLTLDYLVVQNGSIPSTGVSSSTGLSSSARSSATSGVATGSNIGKTSNNTGAIVGGIVGGLLIILLAILGYLCLRRRNKQLALEEKVADYTDGIPQPIVYSAIRTATDGHAYLQQQQRRRGQGGMQPPPLTNDSMPSRIVMREDPVIRLPLIADDFFDEPDNPNPDPPPPPPDTMPGYNPLLDIKRPSTVENYLMFYDTVFLIDDSSSMAEGSPTKWQQCVQAVTAIANIAIDNNTDGIDIYFLNSDTIFKMKDEIRGITNKSKVKAALDRVSPNGNTPTGERLGERLQEHLRKIDNVAGKDFSYREIKPLDLIVITDGSPNDNDLCKSELESAAKHITDNNYHPNLIGVQFVQIGNDHGARDRLYELAHANVNGMVDTVPYTTTLTGDDLKRILLGGMHPNLRVLLNNP